MKYLRVASFVSILGGLIACVRVGVAIAAEVAFEGPHHMRFILPVFTLAAISAVGTICSGIAYLRRPERTTALFVSFGCSFGAWVILASPALHLPASLPLLSVACLYFLVLKPARTREFPKEKGLNQSLETRTTSGPVSA